MNALGFDKSAAATRVVVAMSGGVDSSTAAALMVEQGFEVIGVTLQLYDHGEAMARKGACCAGQDIHDARRVADTLGIPHYVLDYESRFREQVMEEFASSYLAGETPIPCVRCNQTVKFRDLLGMARDLGADALISGHYVRRLVGAQGPELHRALDGAKDQSYFLFATTPEQLDYLRFPLGGMEKAETRRHAERFRLPVAKKPESQDICFVPNGSYARVVEKLRPGAADPGDIVDGEGLVLGRHEGIIHFTVGQRRGLGIAAAEPLYVVRVEPATRRVVVGPREALLTERFHVGDINWLGAGEAPEESLEVTVKVRSTATPARATVGAMGGGAAEVVLHEPEAGIAPGQACVFYVGDRVLGGGWIRRDESP
ncbi:MAG: tRNA 2-thiouridine(34) synthase MnmA [Proteobacteria bacterium]|nr:tRNA 2-thiouridine(34) synthase MnmA [Pseudomonadota bacterium]